mmetsp:Transcript_83471/g.157145  ORF Transcript_83471/g.157145 Transcript_83471/m.157145 type:complete len:272 (+) Transcript_83471:52-867(+)
MLRSLLGLFLVLPATSKRPLNSTSERPLIGIYPTLTWLKPYQEWLAQEGADSIVLPREFHGEHLEEIFQSINGFLIPGAAKSSDRTSAEELVQRAVKANAEESDYFPVWGTCLGFEWLLDMFGNTSMSRGFDSYFLALPLQFTDAARSSRTYAGAGRSLMSWFANEKITYNQHHLGITPEHFASNFGLTSTFKVLSTNPDRKGKHFVSQFEGKSLPFYGTQFHSEKIQFSGGRNCPKSAHAKAGARYLGQFFVSEARKSKHPRSGLGVLFM